MRRKQSLFDVIRLVVNMRNKKTPLIVIVITVAGALFAGGNWLGGDSGTDSGSAPQVSASPDASGTCTVLTIYDGDTITLDCGGGEKTKVRMFCIDAPEMQQKGWGQEARDHLEKIAGNQVKVIAHEKDQYGRTVGEVVTLQGVNLNLEQVRAGKAAVYEQYCKKKNEYLPVQQEAKAANRGIWAKRGMHQTPWTYRKTNK